jgi:hypothetical protein
VPEHPSLIVMIPTRGRRALAEQCLKSYADTVSLETTEIVFVTDPDDQDTYEGMDWGPGSVAVLEPRAGSLSELLNKTASALAGDFDVLMHVSDDCVFVTPGWDRIMLDALEDLGGSGWVYPDDKRRYDVPELWMVSSDVVTELDWFMPPQMGHFYVDNAVGELGKRTGLIRFCPGAVIEHKHYSVCADTPHDETYREAEETCGAPDLVAFRQWQADVMPYEVARLRRQFSPDVSWVLSRVA